MSTFEVRQALDQLNAARDTLALALLKALREQAFLSDREVAVFLAASPAVAQDILEYAERRADIQRVRFVPEVPNQPLLAYVLTRQGLARVLSHEATPADRG